MSIHKAKVCILYTGGTLGMVPNEFGSLAPKKNYLTEQMLIMREFKAPHMPLFDVVEYETLKDSSDLGIDDWCKMAKDIADCYEQYDGFLIAHGTDTMHYTAAALSFFLENLSKPVIVTGAMVPFAEPYNDARRNLIMSMMFAANPDICEVCIFANDVLLRGNRTVKTGEVMSAFESPNFSPLATLAAENYNLKKNLLLPKPKGSFKAYTDLIRSNVLFFYIAPGFDVDDFARYVIAHAPAVSVKEPSRENQVSAIVFEIAGAAEFNSCFNIILKEALDICSKAGVVAVVTNNDLMGPLRQKSIKEVMAMNSDAVLVGSMTSSCAFVKCVYLFGLGLTYAQVRRYLSINMRGEL